MKWDLKVDACPSALAALARRRMAIWCGMAVMLSTNWSNSFDASMDCSQATRQRRKQGRTTQIHRRGSPYPRDARAQQGVATTAAAARGKRKPSGKHNAGQPVATTGIRAHPAAKDFRYPRHATLPEAQQTAPWHAGPRLPYHFMKPTTPSGATWQPKSKIPASFKNGSEPELGPDHRPKPNLANTLPHFFFLLPWLGPPPPRLVGSWASLGYGSIC